MVSENGDAASHPAEYQMLREMGQPMQSLLSVIGQNKLAKGETTAEPWWAVSEIKNGGSFG